MREAEREGTPFREPNNCCNQQLTKYKNKKDNSKEGGGTRIGTVEDGELESGKGGTVRRTTLCANEQLDFILSLGINCSFPAPAPRVAAKELAKN